MLARVSAMPGIDYRGIDPENPAHQKAVLGKLNQFLAAPSTQARKIRAKIQELTTKDATPDMFDAVNVVDVIQSDITSFDFGWQAAFGLVDMRASNKGSFDIMDVTDGLTFAQVKEGEEATIYQISGAKTNVPMDLYGGGLSFSKVWWDDQDYYKIEEASAAFRYKYFKQQADLFYGLIVAVTTAGTFDTDDQTTINNAAADLINDNFGTFPIDETVELLLFCNPQLKKRYSAALNAVVAYTADKQLQFRVRIVTSPHITSTTQSWLVYPGGKSKWGNRMDLSVMGESDIYRYAENVVGWGRYGGAVNAVQIRRLNLS